MFAPENNRAFSLVDLLIVIAISGALCGVAVAAFSSARNDVINSRLQSDVDTINYAIGIFCSKGGSLENLTDPNAILTQLKNHEGRRSAGLVHFLGAADQMIDLRLTARLQTKEEEESVSSRAVWDDESHRFILDTKGRGVKRFFLKSD